MWLPDQYSNVKLFLQENINSILSLLHEHWSLLMLPKCKLFLRVIYSSVFLDNMAMLKKHSP